VTFPADYHAKDLAGKAAVFKCKLNGITVSELPTLDDEFAKDVSEFDTLEAYKADVKKNLEERSKQASDREVESKLCEELVKLMKADVPEAMYVAETENFLRDYDNRMRMQGLDLKTYLQYTGMTLDQMRQQLRPQAEQQVKLRLALEAIAKKENLTAKAEDVEAEYNRISEAYNVPVDQVKGMVAAADIEADMKVKAAMDLVKENAVIKAPAQEKAADAE
jgi:trigger factor